MTTEQLLKRWAGMTGADPKDVAEVIMSIEIFGHSMPRRVSPSRDWWLGRAR